MSQSTLDIRRELVRSLLPTALALFVVPALALGVALWGSSQIGGEYLDEIVRQMSADHSLSAEQRDENEAFLATHPPPTMCAESDPALADYRQGVCAPMSPLWQFHWAARGAIAAIGLGVLGVLASLGLAGAAARSRSAQYWSFVTGSRLLIALVVVEIVAQGALAVWSSYWVTALAMNLYFPKLILVVAVVAAGGMWAAVRGVIGRKPGEPVQEGLSIPEADAPDLWRRIREIAGQLGTTPPTHLVGGIDDNFFVTQAPLALHGPSAAGPRLTGRTLYVSLPLLRILERDEAEAVLAHELAHFRGGDTEASARLGPALVRFDAYLHELGRELLNRPAHSLLSLFRALFEVAFARERRERELLADRTAAEVTSPLALARSLLKISAYSSYRRTTEQALFAETRQLVGSLGLADRVASGLGAHVASAHFKEALEQSGVPHPFDSHPVMSERFANVGATLAEADYAELLLAPPRQSWAEAVTSGADLEAALWSALEARFASAHEAQLAYRYAPATDEERALVLRHFPTLAFGEAGGLSISIDGLRLADGRQFSWDLVSTVALEETLFVKRLTVSLTDAQKLVVQLKPLGPRTEAFKEAFGRYWQRDQVMRQLRAAQGEPPA